MEKGYFIVARNIFANWIWTDDEPFCRRAAWIDLIGLANYTDTKLMVRGKLIEARRGEVNRSIRWLAKRWHWSKSKVERFISLLEKEGMARHETRQGEGVLILCNYSDWQDMWKNFETPNETRARQRRDTRETLTGHEQLKEIKKNENKRNYSLGNNDDGGYFLDPEDAAYGIVPPDMQAKVQQFLEKDTTRWE